MARGTFLATSKTVGATGSPLGYTWLAFSPWKMLLGELACVDSGLLAAGVRTFSMVLVKPETCTVSSCKAIRCACTSACV